MFNGQVSARGAWRLQRFGLVTATGILLATAPPAHAGIIRVDDDAKPGGDGTSWPLAYRHLHLGIAAARPGDEIWVAQGKYLPDPEEGDREVSFTLRAAIAIRGGYAGLGADDPDERDPVKFVSVLSGDLHGDDLPEFQNNADNSLHVVTSTAVGSPAELSGFTITAGKADGAPFPETGQLGAGMVVEGGNPIIRDCRFESSWANLGGGGLALLESNASVTDCTFIGNVAFPGPQSLGGGFVSALGAGATVTRCHFERNRAVYGGGAGTVDAAMTFRECTFVDNIAAPGDGGGYACIIEDGGSPRFINCLFDSNEGVNGGGAFCVAGTPEFNYCTFSRNSADEKIGGVGGAMANVEGSPLLRSSIVWENRPDEIFDVSSATRAKYSDVRGGWPGLGNLDVDPLFRDAQVGDFHLRAGSPVIDAGDTLGNPANVTIDLDGAPRFDDDPCSEDIGSTSPQRFPVDMGPYEYQVPCPVDLDCTGDVDGDDLVQLLAAWARCGWCLEDIDGDGRVGLLDLLDLLAKWGPCP